uniref:Non-specific lipid-transfer protein n=1 Tax=Oryza punctata TaxID=4537 RepID=A0A0E0KKI7_ORYPU
MASARRGRGSIIINGVAVGIVVFVAAAAAAAVMAPGAGAAAVTCGDAVSALAPCGPFLIGGGAARPSERCCSSARSLRAMADTAEARRALCRCLEQSGPSFGVLPDRARRLPALCKLRLAIPVGAATDCSKIS